MSIVASNLLDPNLIVRPDSPPFQVSGVKKKSLSLFRSIDGSQELVMQFMGRDNDSVIMQQEFAEQRVMCAFVSPEGEVTAFANDGSLVEEEIVLCNQFNENWTPGRIGLVIESKAWQDFVAMHDAQPDAHDGRFAAALSGVKRATTFTPALAG